MMKKKEIVTICFLVLVSFFGNAQEKKEDPRKEEFSYGIKAGWIQSNLYGNDLDFLAVDSKTTEKNDFFAGVFAFNRLGNYFGLKHELFYQQYGASFKREVGEVGKEQEIDADLNMTSLRLNPINLTFTFGGFELYGGPYLNALLTASITNLDENGNKYRDKDIFGNESEDTEEYKYLQKMDYGFVVGAEYRFKFGLSLGVHYSRGFAPIFDNANSFGLESTPGIKTYNIYNESFGASLGYHF